MRSLMGRRRGFTLVEMLVVMAMILIVTVTVVAVGPGLRQDQRVSNAAEQVQGWLFIAKQRAYRDKKPRGIRLLDPTTTPNFITEIQYIEQPDDIIGNTLTVDASDRRIVTLDQTADGVDPPSASNPAGCFLKISDIEPDSPPRGHLILTAAGATLTLQTPINGTDTSLVGAAIYRVVRSPKPMVGEPNVQLPANTGILLTGTSPFVAPPREITFGPTGAILGSEEGKIHLWVADMTSLSTNVTDPAFQNRSALITIYAKTGMISSFPVAPGANPYLYTNSGQARGL